MTIPASDLPLTTAVAKALVREQMLRMAAKRGVMAIDPLYVASAVEKLWGGTDEVDASQRTHYLALAAVAIAEVRGYLQVPTTAPGALPKRSSPILENTAVVHEQKPSTEPVAPAEVKPLTEPAYQGHIGVKGFAHPVDVFIPPAVTEPKKDA